MSEHTQDVAHHDPYRGSGAETPEKRPISGQAAQELVSRLRGELILPEEAVYEAARRVWNGAVNRYPALIACCKSVGDVIAAVTVAREQALPLSVRSGGHSIAGYGTNDGGIVIDLSRMKALSINPERRTARIEPGLIWGEVSHALQPTGLTLTAGDTATVGVGGLMLGGGIGWMVRKYGLTIDHLRAVELVNSGWPAPLGQRGRAQRPVLGTARWWGQLRHRDGLRGGPAPRRDRSGQSCLL